MEIFDAFGQFGSSKTLFGPPQTSFAPSKTFRWIRPCLDCTTRLISGPETPVITPGTPISPRRRGGRGPLLKSHDLYQRLTILFGDLRQTVGTGVSAVQDPLYRLHAAWKTADHGRTLVLWITDLIQKRFRM